MSSSTSHHQQSSLHLTMLVPLHGNQREMRSVTRFVHDGAYVSLEIYRLWQHARLSRRVLIGSNRHSHLEGHLTDVAQVRIDTRGIQLVLQQGKKRESGLPKRLDEEARQARRMDHGRKASVNVRELS